MAYSWLRLARRTRGDRMAAHRKSDSVVSNLKLRFRVPNDGATLPLLVAACGGFGFARNTATTRKGLMRRIHRLTSPVPIWPQPPRSKPDVSSKACRACLDPFRAKQKPPRRSNVTADCTISSVICLAHYQTKPNASALVGPAVLCTPLGTGSL